jgi:1-acyl-sn-glycerol-3-phosphate acyltransferase/membrane protein YqaA with SNARE-associated domain
VRAAAFPARAGLTESEWGRGRLAHWLRTFVQAAVLLPLVRWLGRPLRIDGADALGAGPYVFVANHASHADTAAILAALPPRLRRRTAPAAAADYFFSSRVRGALVTLVTGAFPFPRKGRTGLARAESLLQRGWSVVLFPEGTRSCDGRVHGFRPGVAALAERGWTVVPIGIAGTSAALPKGGRLPRRSPLALSFGEPLRFPAMDTDVPARLERNVRALATDARRRLAPQGRLLYDRAAAFARSPRALLLCLAWGFAEALWAPVVPDFVVAPLALAAPARGIALALCAVTGSIGGGAVAYALGASDLGPTIASHLPLVTERMSVFARDALATGPEGLLRQPMSGVPYKAFAYQSAGVGLGMVSFLWFSLVARAARLVAVAGFFGLVGVAARRVWRRVYGPFLVFYSLCFGVGLARVVAAWS